MAIAIGEVRYREPLAVVLLRSLCQGKTIEDLVIQTGIPEEGIWIRVEAAKRFLAGG